MGDEWLTEPFEANLPHMRQVAFRLLGSSAEADDASRRPGSGSRVDVHRAPHAELSIRITEWFRIPSSALWVISWRGSRHRHAGRQP